MMELWVDSGCRSPEGGLNAEQQEIALAVLRSIRGVEYVDR